MRNLVLVLFLFLSSCSALTSIAKDVILDSGGGPSLTVDTDLVNGNNSKDTNVQLGNDQKIDNVANYVQKNVGPLELFFIILGWICPSPTAMYREVKSWFSRRKK